MNNSTAPKPVLNDTHLISNYLHFLIVLNSLSSILAGVLNFLVILTFLKTASLRTPSSILILSLAFSDLGVGVVTQPAYCCLLIALLTKNSSGSLYEGSSILFFRTLPVLITVSLLTATSITVDRFLAVHFHLRYQELVTTKRTYIAVITMWIVGLLWSLAYRGLELNWRRIAHAVFVLFIVILDIYLMMRIAGVIRRHSAQIHAQQLPQQSTMNMQTYKKSVNVMYYIMGVFLVCCLPTVVFFFVYSVMAEARVNIGIEAYYAEHLFLTLALINSALNPFIYCWRMEEIRNALVTLLRRQ